MTSLDTRPVFVRTLRTSIQRSINLLVEMVVMAGFLLGRRVLCAALAGSSCEKARACGESIATEMTEIDALMRRRIVNLTVRLTGTRSITATA